MLEYAYRTEARMLNRIRVRVPDKPGVLARITQTLGAAGINIEDFELRHVSPEYGGVLVILVSGADNAELARTLLRREGYSAGLATLKSGCVAAAVVAACRCRPPGTARVAATTRASTALPAGADGVPRCRRSARCPRPSSARRALSPLKK